MVSFVKKYLKKVRQLKLESRGHILGAYFRIRNGHEFKITSYDTNENRVWYIGGPVPTSLILEDVSFKKSLHTGMKVIYHVRWDSDTPLRPVQ